MNPTARKATPSDTIAVMAHAHLDDATTEQILTVLGSLEVIRESLVTLTDDNLTDLERSALQTLRNSVAALLG